MNNQEQFQNELLKDFKDLVNELSQIKTFSGLMIHQQKIQYLYEKFIFLKQLNNLKYSQILDSVFTNSSEIQKEVSESTLEQEVDIPTSIESVEENENVSTPEFVQESNLDGGNKENSLSEESIQEIQVIEKDIKLTPLNVEIAEIKPQEKTKAFEPIHLDFNDSIAFISQLFNGSKADMDKEFAVLNKTQSIEEARKWMEEMFHTYNWKNKEEFVERLSGLIINRFEL